MQRRHQQGRRSSLTRHIPKRDHQPAILTLDKVVVIAADLVTRKTDALKLVTIHMRRRRRLKALLDLTGECELTLQSFALESRFNETRILNTNGSHRCERSQNLQVIFSEPT